MRGIILVNGAGLGNAVRIEPILREFTKRNIQYDLFCSGNARDYFSFNGIKFESLEQLQYGVKDGELSMMRTLTLSNLLKNCKIIQKNNEKLKEFIYSKNYDFALTDSVYNIKYLKRKKIPIYSVNNSNFLCENYGLIEDKIDFPTKIHYHCVETLDYLFHSRNMKNSFSPTFIKGKNNSVFIDTPLISKNGVLPSINKNNVLFMLSGSNWKSQVLIHNANNWLSEINSLFVVGINPEKVKKDNEQIKLIGRTFNNLEYLNSSKIAVINAGFSAISEMIVARKPMIVIPLENHAEQFFNAYMIEKLGLGIVANINNWETKIKELLDNYNQYSDNFNKIDNYYYSNGASFIADRIKEEIKNA